MTPRDRAILGALILTISATLTFFRARAVAEPLAALPKVTQLHREGRATDDALSNAVYHGTHAKDAYEERWHLSGYALQGLIGGALGIVLILWRPSRSAA